MELKRWVHRSFDLYLSRTYHGSKREERREMMQSIVTTLGYQASWRICAVRDIDNFPQHHNRQFFVLIYNACDEEINNGEHSPCEM